MSGEDRSGRCYELAGRTAVQNPGVLLVHGSIQGPGYPRIAHAWVDLGDGTVYEPRLDKRFPVDFWQKVANPIPEQVYTTKELSDLLLFHRTWGPWVEPLHPTK